MGFAEWLILLAVCMFFVAYIFCAIVSRVLAYTENKTILDHHDQSDGSQNVEQKASNVKDERGDKWHKLVSKMYYGILPYAYGFVRYMTNQTGKIPSTRVRKSLYRIVFCMKITPKTVLYGGSEFRSPWNIKLGNCVVSNHCLFDGRRGITVADNVVFGAGVHMWTEEHAVNDPMFRVLERNRQPIVIDERAWICSDSTILPGVHIGEGAVIASRACVTKDCEPYGIYAGVPARKIGERNRELKYTLDGKPTWHFY